MFSDTALRMGAEPNALYRLRDEIMRQGHSVVDLVSGNVTEHGLLFPQDRLEEILLQAGRAAQFYRPDPFGQLPARQAVGEYYEQRGVTLHPRNVVLTPGTSISYWYCFKLLANEGDEILCPSPSYPLFDYIAALCGVRMAHYSLDEQRGWAIDLDDLENQVSNSTRAIVLISPHNPTGRVTTQPELERLAEVALRHRLPVIADEVFSEFLFSDTVLPRPAGTKGMLVFTLNGFSKMFALPGLKLGWIGVSGPEDSVRTAMRALEIISDTFLPVSEIVQAAVPGIFPAGHDFLPSYRSEICARRATAEGRLRAFPGCSYVPPDAGFYVTVRLEEIDEDKAAETILRKSRLLTHPGYFYDMKPDHLVFSFVHRPERLDACLSDIRATLAGLQKQG
ncbi:MAG: pyridoxal phosphate-dependent aminotransferase [Acidobacteria bacterium]|nr:pyridoxal phosphate-dependent aminotransferase [Acidobacteriota bacterium]